MFIECNEAVCINCGASYCFGTNCDVGPDIWGPSQDKLDSFNGKEKRGFELTSDIYYCKYCNEYSCRTLKKIK